MDIIRCNSGQNQIHVSTILVIGLDCVLVCRKIFTVKIRQPAGCSIVAFLCVVPEKTAFWSDIFQPDVDKIIIRVVVHVVVIDMFIGHSTALHICIKLTLRFLVQLPFADDFASVLLFRSRHVFSLSLFQTPFNLIVIYMF